VFAFKKIVGAFAMPTGLVVVALLVSGWLWVRGRSKKAGAFNLVLGLGLWLASLPMVSHWLDRGLTAGLQMPAKLEADVIVLLGGGADDKSVDISGVGTPTDSMAARMMTAARLYRRLDAPIIVTGGALFNATQSEAVIVRRLLVDLGVPAARIILEDKARDTMENARYTKSICTAQGFKQPLLVTSVLHLKRSLWCFRRVGLEVTPVPVGLSADRTLDLGWEQFLPGSLDSLHQRMHEYLGLAYYWLVY